MRAVEVTPSSIGDAPMLPDLLNQIPADEDLGSVTADGAFDTRKCHDAVATNLGAIHKQKDIEQLLPWNYVA